MQRFTVTGMSCAACSSRVEKAVSSLEGVSSCSVNLLTGSMGVEGTVSSADIVAACAGGAAGGNCPAAAAAGRDCNGH